MAATHNLGFARIGAARELKFAQEDYCKAIKNGCGRAQSQRAHSREGLWINPDGRLKTRQGNEVLPALQIRRARPDNGESAPLYPGNRVRDRWRALSFCAQSQPSTTSPSKRTAFAVLSITTTQ